MKQNGAINRARQREIDRRKRMLAKGMTYAQVALRCGVSTQAVWSSVNTANTKGVQS